MSFKRLFRGSPASYDSMSFLTPPQRIHSGVDFLKEMALVHLIKWVTFYKGNAVLNTDMKLNLARDMCMHKLALPLINAVEL